MTLKIGDMNKERNVPPTSFPHRFVSNSLLTELLNSSSVCNNYQWHRLQPFKTLVDIGKQQCIAFIFLLTENKVLAIYVNTTTINQSVISVLMSVLYRLIRIWMVVVTTVSTTKTLSSAPTAE